MALEFKMRSDKRMNADLRKRLDIVFEDFLKRYKGNLLGKESLDNLLAMVEAAVKPDEKKASFTIAKRWYEEYLEGEK